MYYGNINIVHKSKVYVCIMALYCYHCLWYDCYCVRITVQLTTITLKRTNQSFIIMFTLYFYFMLSNWLGHFVMCCEGNYLPLHKWALCIAYMEYHANIMSFIRIRELLCQFRKCNACNVISMEYRCRRDCLSTWSIAWKYNMIIYIDTIRLCKSCFLRCNAIMCWL